jgi:hypothetical protein
MLVRIVEIDGVCGLVCCLKAQVEGWRMPHKVEHLSANRRGNQHRVS